MLSIVVLLVESRRTGTLSMAPALRKARCHVVVTHTGKDTREQLLRFDTPPHAIVFDSTAMRSSGTRTCRQIHRSAPDIPIIHCRDEEAELDERAEAQVYLQRPFTARKLLNRIKNFLPPTDDEADILSLGNMVLYRKTRALHIEGRGEFTLTPKLLGLLELFIQYPEEVIGRSQLMREIWNTDYVGDTRTLDVHIRWLREILEENPAKPKRLVTLRGKGYRLILTEDERQEVRDRLRQSHRPKIPQ